MNQGEKPMGLGDYLQVAVRRKWWILLPLLAGVVISLGVYKSTPKVYRATTLILVQPQKVPEQYIHPLLTSSINERLNTISEEILSRTKLEQVIRELHLYADLRVRASMEGIVEMMRRAIQVTVNTRGSEERNHNSFSISFEGEDPRTVMMVTNRLADLFIKEKLKGREQQAERTSEFLSKELHLVETQFRRQEEEIRQFKDRHMGQLPQQQEANLRIFERLQMQIQAAADNIRQLEARGHTLQTQIDQLRRPSLAPLLREAGAPPLRPEETGLESLAGEPALTQMALLKRELRAARSRYTPDHPDVLELQDRIAKLEPAVQEALKKQEEMKQARLRELRNLRQGTPPSRESSAPPATADPFTSVLIAQYQEQFRDAQAEAARLRREMSGLKEQSLAYQRRIEETPKWEQELARLTRDYELIKSKYHSLLDKKGQAQMAESLERKQQSEQFKVLDPAALPEKPVKPDRNRILLLGAMIGLFAGLGLAYIRESLDQSVHGEAELEEELALPVLAVIPNLKKGKR